MIRSNVRNFRPKFVTCCAIFLISNKYAASSSHQKWWSNMLETTKNYHHFFSPTSRPLPSQHSLCIALTTWLLCSWATVSTGKGGNLDGKSIIARQVVSCHALKMLFHTVVIQVFCFDNLQKSIWADWTTVFLGCSLISLVYESMIVYQPLHSFCFHTPFITKHIFIRKHNLRVLLPYWQPGKPSKWYSKPYSTPLKINVSHQKISRITQLKWKIIWTKHLRFPLGGNALNFPCISLPLGFPDPSRRTNSTATALKEVGPVANSWRNAFLLWISGMNAMKNCISSLFFLLRNIIW